MITWLRIAVIAALLGACANQPSSHVCASGIICPDPLQCAAVQQVCITNNCGNGILDPGEVCDDGNIIDGDGCSANCLSAERCGDHLVNVAAGEVCDDGNTVSGDGCSADCRSNETCGNGIVDVGEVCDDSGTHDGTCNDDHITPCNNDGECTGSVKCVPDGCSKDCKSTEVCGNGITDLGEACDGGSGCEPDCSAGIGCGNGKIDTGEQCDDGNNNTNDDCKNDCTINVCGDGVQNTGTHNHEDCDPAVNFGETAGCNSDCTIPSCGDSKVNHHFMPDGTHGEQCDSGTIAGVNQNADDKDCTANCLVNVCGDGLADSSGPDHVEACDPAATPTTCNGNCSASSCGDGILNTQFVVPGTGGKTEQCDRGGSNSDGVGSLCTTHCQIPTCGDGIIQGLEECDNGAANSNTGDCTTACRIARCGDGLVDASASALHEGCDPGAPNINTATCNSNCTLATCGDGFINPAFVVPGTGGKHEQCDDAGNNSDSKDCTSHCQIATCGDNFIDNAGTLAEQCDNGSGNSNTGDCTLGCKSHFCGDGLVDATAGEQCDPNTGAGINTATAASDGTACDKDCTIRTCGDGYKNANETCDPSVTPATCNFDCTSSSCGDGKLNTDFVVPGTGGKKEQCDLGAMNSDGSGSQCTTHCQIPTCGDGITQGIEECDLGGSNSDSGNCTTACKLARCGDGHVDTTPGGQHEDCDPGTAKQNTATCNFDCTLPSCGDGINNVLFVVPGTGGKVEQCDAGAGNGDSKDCTSHCQLATCGDGLIDNLGTSVEQCDDGANNSDNKDCTSRCNTSFCGDGHVDTSGTFTELCDPGTGAGGNRATANADSAWCDFNCTLPVCGDNHQNTSAGETCDDGNTIATDACTNVCRLATCGDYVVHVGVETCDMGPTDTATCNGAGAGAASCAPPTCGDGYINAAAGEVCDNNNFGGQSCITKGFSGGGPLLCTGSCTTIDTTNCTP